MPFGHVSKRLDIRVISSAVPAARYAVRQKKPDLHSESERAGAKQATFLV
jgi:hypothetical protein